MVARFPNWPPNGLSEDNSLFATLLFGDGSQKMLAAITTWVAMLLCWRHHGSAALDEKTVTSMVASFLNIQTIVKATDCRGSHLESVINRIVQQNAAAKVQPITSFGWSSILRSVSGSAERVQQTTFEEALQCYNNHPDVVSHDRADSGSGSIALDGRKRQGVRNWMERTCSEAYEEVLKSCHDIAFNLGPFGEVFSYNNICFLRSVSGMEALSGDPEMAQAPLPGEAFVAAAYL